VEVVVFRVEGERYALETEAVREVVRAVAVARLPQAPPIVLGVIAVRGRVIPVLDLRARFGLPPRAIDPGEMFVVAETEERAVALRADMVEGVALLDPEEVFSTREAVSSSDYVMAAARLADGLVLVHDLNTFLDAAEARSLDAALAAAREGG
jgi:purine-binding chemotaxis protein CheW